MFLFFRGKRAYEHTANLFIRRPWCPLALPNRDQRPRDANQRYIVHPNPIYLDPNLTPHRRQSSHGNELDLRKYQPTNTFLPKGRRKVEQI
jgi:hypothetical protein